MYAIVYTKTALKDIPKLKAAHLDDKAKELIAVIRENPYQTPPPYEKLVGDLKGLYSRRINGQHRLVYEVFEREQTIKIVSLWSHYERWSWAAICGIGAGWRGCYVTLRRPFAGAFVGWLAVDFAATK